MGVMMKKLKEEIDQTNAESANMDHVYAQIKHINYIYETLFPDHTLEIHAWWEKTGVTTPAVHEQTAYYWANMFVPSYIGRYIIGSGTLATKQVHVTIPSVAQTNAATDKQIAWEARPSLFRAFHRYTPLLAEDLKYLVERRRATKMVSKNKFLKLPFGTGVLTLPVEARDTLKDPAVLIGFHWLSYGGAEKLAFDTVDWALEQGLRVIVVADVKGPQPLIDKLPDDPRVTVLRMDCYVPRNLMSAFLVALIARENIVLTHNHHCTALYEALPAMRARHPDVVHIDSLHIVEHLNGGYPRISGVWSNFLDYHHVISTDLKGFYRKNFRVNRKAILGRLLDDAQREATPQPLRIMAGQKSVRVIFVGRMMHQKRPVLVVDIFRKLARWGQKNGVAFQFDLVGEGPYRAAIDALVTVYGLRDCIRFHDAGNDIPALLAQSDILILPSANEGLALVCYEAIEQGCVPISSDVGAQAELMPDALLVPWAPRRAVKYTVAVVKRLLSDQEHVLDMQIQLHARFAKLAAEPSAKDVISALYAKAKDTAQTATKVTPNPKAAKPAKSPKTG